MTELWLRLGFPMLLHRNQIFVLVSAAGQRQTDSEPNKRLNRETVGRGSLSMEKNNNHKADIMRATIELVAEDFISAVTTRRVANRAGVSDGLMYRFFVSKEELLISCLYQITDKITEHLHGFMEIQTDSMEEYKKEVRSRWNVFFSCLMEHVSETLFFHEYANSASMMKLAREGKFQVKDFTSMLAERLGAANPKFTHASEGNNSYFWLFYVHVSMIFAVRMIRGELPDTDQSRDKVWKLIANGISSFLFTDQ